MTKPLKTNTTSLPKNDQFNAYFKYSDSADLAGGLVITLEGRACFWMLSIPPVPQPLCFSVKEPNRSEVFLIHLRGSSKRGSSSLFIKNFTEINYTCIVVSFNTNFRYGKKSSILLVQVATEDLHEKQKTRLFFYDVTFQDRLTNSLNDI